MSDGSSGLSVQDQAGRADTYRMLIEHSLFGTAILDKDGQVLYASPRMAQFYGLTPEEAVGRNGVDLLIPEDRERARYRLARYFAGEQVPWFAEGLRPLRADGALVELELSASPAELDGRRVLMVSAIDMTLRNRTQRVLNKVAEAVSSKIGQQFFASLVLNLTTSLGVDYAFVGEVLPGTSSARMIAVAQDGVIVEGMTYDLADTPCSTVVGAELCWHPSGVQSLYPRDELLVEMGVNAYAGTPLIDSSGMPIGLLAIMNRREMPRDPVAEAALQIYAVRAAAELERQRAERALVAANHVVRRSGEKYWRLFANLPVAAWESDWSAVLSELQGQGIESVDDAKAALAKDPVWFARLAAKLKVVEVNRAALALAGVSDKDAYEKWIATTAYPPEAMRQYIVAAAPLVLFESPTVTFEITLRRPDGELIEVLMLLARAENWRENRSMFAIAVDVTDAKRAERGLVRAKGYVDNLIETANVMILELDLDGKVLRLNRMGEEITGYRREELLNRCWFDIMMPPRRAPHAEAYLRGLREGNLRRVNESPILTRDGSERIISWRNSEVRNDDGAIIGSLSFGNDVTERRNAEAERERLQKAMELVLAEWRGTFDTVNTPIVIADAAGTVTRVNRAARDLANKAFAEIVGHPVAECGPGEPWQTASELVRYMVSESHATSAETKDEAGRTWDISIARFSIDEDSAPRFILVLWEITGIVELQEALRRGETMSAMGTLVGAVAHEVRNPLFGISATLDAYEDELRNPALAECTSALRAQVHRLTQLMQELLDYGKPPVMSIEMARIDEVIGEAMGNRATLARESAVTIAAEVPAMPPVLMDRLKMRQVFENLIDNALQHSPHGGVVRLSGELVAQGGRNWLELRIEDQGPGFAAETLDRVFEPFFTKRSGGTGLGLSIVQRIVEEHSGRVTAGNRNGGGAVITVRLPMTGE
ncbi:MAG TPA: PAS domain S-box protein [Thermoanaerobaculia bacterium]|nr:PAS domain S-box protein [Thermoanaerobaculia bacterium]